MATAKKTTAKRATQAKPTTPVVEKAEVPVRRKYICRRKCQPRCDDGKVRFFNAGDTFYFVNPPVHFAPINALGLGDINWNIIEENILRDENAVPLSYMTKFMFDTYGEQLEGFPRKAVVDKLISFRGLDTSTLSSTPAVAPTAAEFKNNNTEANAGITFEAEEGVSLDDGDSLDDLLGDDI